MLVQPGEFRGLGPGGGSPHALEAEKLSNFIQGENFVVAVGPAQAHEPIGQGFGQMSCVPKILDRDVVPPLGKFFARFAHDQGEVGKDGQGSIQSLVEGNLERCVRVVIGSSNHVGDPHFDIVDHYGEGVQGSSVSALDDRIAQLLGVLTAGAKDRVVPSEHSLPGNPQANHMGAAIGPEAEIPAASVVETRSAPG